MNTQQLKESLEFIKKTSSVELQEKHLKTVFDTYHKVFGEVCTGCPAKIAGYISRLKKTNNYIIMKKPSNFKLKKGTIIPIPGTSKVYSNANLTDKVALEFLKENPNRKELFIEVPENLDELFLESNEAEFVKINDQEFSFEDALKVLEYNEINTRATTVNGLQNKVNACIEEGIEIKTDIE